MICCFCLIDSNSFFNFFDSKGLELNASDIVAKYFWFKPSENDSSHEVCLICWKIIEDFHNLYQKVKNSQKNLSNLKTDPELFCVSIKSEQSNIEELHEDDIFPTNSYATLDAEFDSKNYHNNIKPLFLNINADEKSFQTKLRFSESSIENVDSNRTDGPKDEENLENSANSHHSDEKSFDFNKRVRRKYKTKKLKLNKTQKSIENQEDTIQTVGPKDEENLENNSTSHHSDEKNVDLNKTVSRKYKTKKSKSNGTQKSSEEQEAKKLKIKEEDKMIQGCIELSCPICSEPIKTFTSLSRHFMKDHKKQKSYLLCCGTKFSKRNKFVDHIKTHTNPTSFKCDLCGRLLANRWNLRGHMKRVHSESKDRKFQCEQCDKAFTSGNGLMRHISTHVPESERLFKCDACDKSYGTKVHLTYHVKCMHAEDRYAGVCDICGKKYRQKVDLVNHRSSHDQIEQPKIQCNICKGWYKNEHLLKIHIGRSHSKIPESNLRKCPHCDKTSPTPHALRDHIRYTHMMKKKIECNLCQKTFRRPREIKEHMAWHTGTALYKCPYCPKTFSHSSNLHHHRKQVHRKEFEEVRAQHGRTFNWTKFIQIENTNTSTTHITSDS